MAGMKMPMMQMYFTASTHVTLWLKEWHTGTPIWYEQLYLQEFSSCFQACGMPVRTLLENSIHAVLEMLSKTKVHVPKP